VNGKWKEKTCFWETKQARLKVFDEVLGSRQGESQHYVFLRASSVSIYAERKQAEPEPVLILDLVSKVSQSRAHLGIGPGPAWPFSPF
jgi:hypothetical protein